MRLAYVWRGGPSILFQPTRWSEWSAQAVVRAVVRSVCTTGMLLGEEEGAQDSTPEAPSLAGRQCIQAFPGTPRDISSPSRMPYSWMLPLELSCQTRRCLLFWNLLRDLKNGFSYKLS